MANVDTNKDVVIVNYMVNSIYHNITCIYGPLKLIIEIRKETMFAYNTNTT